MSYHSIHTISSLASTVMVLLATDVACLSPLVAAPTVTITSPADGAVFHPGQTLDITVTATPLAFRTVVVTVGDLHPSGRTEVLTAAPYRFRIRIPSRAVPGPYMLLAVGVTPDGTAVDSDPITVAVERPESPLKLESDLHTLIFDYASGSAALVVYGTFPDGAKVDLTRSTLTKHASDRPEVATVDANGVVTAVSPGSARITVTNGNAVLVIPVTVADKRLPEGKKR